MFRKTTFITTLAILFSGFTGTSSAASLSDQWYLGAGYASSRLAPDAAAGNVTRTQTIGQGATVFFGRDFDERSSGQIQLYSLGDAIFSDNSTATYTAADASLLYRFYDSRDTRRNAQFGLSIYGRFGVGFIERDSITALSADGASPVHFGAGAGLEAYLTNMFAVRSEMIFHEKDTISANVSVVARFGGRKSRTGGFGAPPTSSTASAPRGTQPQTTASPVRKPQALPIPQDYNLPEVAVMVDPNNLSDSGSNPRRPQPVQSGPSTSTPQGRNDTDNDGVSDDNDLCRLSNPDYPVQQNGCSSLVHFGGQIQFVANSPLPLPGTERVLEQLAAKMSQFPKTRIELIAHTDNAGDPQAKSAIARQRLRAIGIFLAQRGISQNRFLLRSFAGKRPAFDNSTAEGRQANNRIEIVEKP